MPYRKKQTKKRPYRRRRKYNPFKVMRTPMPPKFATKLRYYQNVSVDPGTGTMTTYSFAANGLTQPNLTGSGHQPRGFDQFMLMYNHYVVVGAKITATFLNSDPNIPIVVGCYVGTDAATATDLRDFLEQGNRKYKVLSADTHGGSSITTVTEFGSPKKEFGITNMMDNTNLRGYVSGNPTEILYFHLFSCSQNEVGNPTTTDVSVMIEYSVVFGEPNDLAAS